MSNPFKKALLGATCLSVIAIPHITLANDNLFDMSLEELMDIKVTTASKREESLFEVASSIYVLTKEDIRRSGATTVADALRLVPGMNVARTDTAGRAVSARGFNSSFANKLLVLRDGRTLYTPLFSGVYWDVQDVVLEDIKQIEVIRGPGAALWGANAVNGVINIITESAKDTKRNYVSATYGNQERGTAEGIYAGVTENELYYKATARHASRHNSKDLMGNDTSDEMEHSMASFRAEKAYGNTNFTAMGDAYRGTKDLNLTVPYLPTSLNVLDKNNQHGGNVVLKWERTLDDGNTDMFQVYYDSHYRQYDLLEQQNDIIDLEYQRTSKLDNHHLIYGGGYRFTYDELNGTPYLDFRTQERYSSLYNVFIQDKITLSPESLYLTLGSKFEYNDFTDFEFQPSAQLSWNISDNQFAWASVARAVRTPSRAEQDIRIVAAVLSSGAIVRQDGSRDFDSEDMIAYEVGYRIKPTEKTAIDTSVFYNDYSNLRTSEIQGLTFSGGLPFLVVNQDNLGEGRSYGAEVSARYQATEDWSLVANYTYLDIDLKLDANSTDTRLLPDEEISPNHQFNIQSRLDVTDDLQFDVTAYYVDDVLGSDQYIRGDVRLAWEPTDSWQLELVGQNLFDDLHPESQPQLQQAQTQVPRSYYARASYRF